MLNHWVPSCEILGTLNITGPGFPTSFFSFPRKISFHHCSILIFHLPKRLRWPGSTFKSSALKMRVSLLTRHLALKKCKCKLSFQLISTKKSRKYPVSSLSSYHLPPAQNSSLLNKLSGVQRFRHQSHHTWWVPYNSPRLSPVYQFIFILSSVTHTKHCVVQLFLHLRPPLQEPAAPLNSVRSIRTLITTSVISRNRWKP